MSLTMKQARVGGYVAPGLGGRRGDPGVFGFLGNTIKNVAGGFISGGPLGAIRGGIQTVSRALRGNKPSSVTEARARAQRMLERGEIRNVNRQLDRWGFQPSAERTQTERWSFDPGMQQQTVPAGAGVACPQGYHPNKSGYWKRVDKHNPEAGAVWVPEKSVCVKNRRYYNPGNAKATDRAISRIKGAKRMAKSLSRITVREKKC